MAENLAKDGGKPEVKPPKYEKPVGPKGIPGNGPKPTTNKGQCGTQGKY